MKLKLSSMIVSAAFLGLILNCISAFGQLAEPANDLGVRLGHIHLVVKNLEAQTKFWTEMMGGAVVKTARSPSSNFPESLSCCARAIRRLRRRGRSAVILGSSLKTLN